MSLYVVNRTYQMGGGRFNTVTKAFRIILYEVLDQEAWDKHCAAWLLKKLKLPWTSVPIRSKDKRIRVWKTWITTHGSVNGPRSQYGRAMAEAQELRDGGLFYVHLKLGKPGHLADWRSEKLKSLDRLRKAS